MKHATITANECARLYFAACGPATRESLASEINRQVPGATRENCRALADTAIESGLAEGWLARYDDTEAFDIA